MRSQQKEWVNRDVAQNPIEHKDNQNRISNPCPQGKPRFPEQNADQDQRRKQQQIITERRIKISVKSRIKRTRRPASGTVEPRQPVKGALRQPARHNGVMEIQENQPDSAGSRQKNKNRSFTKRSCFIFLTGSFPADSRKSGCCMIRKSPEHLQRKIDSIDDNSGAECNPCPHGSF